MDPFTWPAEFPGLPLHPLTVCMCVLALLSQLWDVVPSARVFLGVLHCSPVWPGAQCAAQAGFERTAVFLL